MEGTVEAIEATEDTEDTTTARGPLMLRLRLMLSPPPLPSLDMATTAMATDTELTDTVMLLLTPTDIITPMARGLLMPSPDMVGTTAMGTEVTTEDIMATVATEDTTTARGLLMLSQDMVTTVMGTE